MLNEAEKNEALQTHQNFPHELLQTTRRLRQLLEISAFVGAYTAIVVATAVYIQPACQQ